MNYISRLCLALIGAFTIGIAMPSAVDAAGFITPPREVVIVKPVMPAIPSGVTVAPTMRVRFLIDKDGLVKNVFIEQSSGYAPVDEAVRQAIMKWEYKPAIGKDKKPHGSIIGMTITLPTANHK